MSAQAVAAAAVAVFWVLLLSVLVQAVRLRREIQWKEALVIASPVVGMSLLAPLAAAASTPPGGLAPGFGFLAAVAFDALQTTAFIAVGAHAARATGHEALCVLREGTAGRVLVPGLAVGLAGAAAAFAVLRLAPVEAATPAPGALGVLLALHAAVAEELVYRLGLQWQLTRWLGGGRSARRAALALTAVLFVAVHLATLEPAWLRALELLPLALALGWLSLRRGILACGVAHGVFNLLALTPGFIPGSG